ncbi:hypothetical protein [Pelagibius sp.]|uniref:hypothetical protein n=1 Tax=Pelagibius sp. TaxID=1931238 RepID=UPI002629446C|nr:hypothetical protein [Pelagibius sp.]
MIQVKPQPLSSAVSITQTASSVGLPGLGCDADPAHRAVRRFHARFHVADGVFDIFEALPVPKASADRHQGVLRALLKRRQFSAGTAAIPANPAMMTFLRSCAAMALPPLREYLTR